MSRKNSPFSKIFTTLTYKQHFFCYILTKVTALPVTAATYAKGKPKEGGEDTNRSQARLLSSARKICFRSLIHNVKRY